MATRLLLADDHRMLRQSLRRSLEDEGYDIVGEARDGLEAVSLTLDLAPDVVLMDVSMPGIDGVEATRRIMSATHAIRVVMLTMHADVDVARRALSAGATGYLIKDCSIDEVHQAIQQAVVGQLAVAETSAECTRSRAPAVVLRRPLQHRGCRAPVHQRQDRQEPSGLHLRQARRTRPD
jgi:two-component system, NarL family, response regulator DegU